MSATIDITEVAALSVVRGFIISMIPNVEVIRGEQNQTPLPLGPNWIEIMPITRRRLGTNIETYDGTSGFRYAMTATEMTVQSDFFGPSAADNAQIIANIWRDRAATEFFDGFNGAPLFAGEARQMAFVNDQSQYEFRWTVDLKMQMNPTVSLAQQFANSLSVGLLNVSASFP